MSSREIVLLVRGLTRPVIVLLLTSAVIALSFLGREVPEVLKSMSGIAFGFWFAAHTLAKDG